MNAEWVLILLGAVALIGLGALLYWLLIITEGVYLGRGVVIALYDLYARRYDHIKQFEPIYEHALLAQPVLDRLAPHQSPLLLDVATGTGRMPVAMRNHKRFQGHIIGLDLSRAMLHEAADKLEGADEITPLLWCAAESLPFADATFDGVICLESLEFMMDPAAVVAEMARVLRPGGLMLITRRINARLMPGKTWDNDQLAGVLYDCGMIDAEVEVWQEDYHRVWAIKAGEALAVGARPLGEILRCPRCRDSLLIETADAWTCPACDLRALVGTDGVIELHSAKKATGNEKKKQ